MVTGKTKIQGNKAVLTFTQEEYNIYDIIEKTPKAADNGKNSITAKIALPKSWAGKKVLCILTEDPRTPAAAEDCNDETATD